MADTLYEACKLLDLQESMINVLKKNIEVLQKRVKDQEEIIDLLKKTLEVEEQLREAEKNQPFTICLN